MKENMPDTGKAFLAHARSLLASDYLPKIERCLEKLDDEQVWWRAGAASNSIGNLLLHLSGNARQWIVSGICGAADERARQREFDARAGSTRAELLESLRATLSEVDAILARAEPATLLEQRRIQECDVSVLEAVFHVVEHFSMHTGQIILLTKMLTQSDLRFYDFSTGVPLPTWNERSIDDI